MNHERLLITVTGADDQVDPAAMLALARKYPFVEWGILWSRARSGRPRYPSTRWISRLPLEQLSLSWHLCGKSAIDVLEGPWRFVRRGHRVQFNQVFSPTPAFGFALKLGCRRILQCPDVTHLDAFARLSIMHQAHLLFDPSGGRGSEQMHWPPTPLGVLRMGLAGGIGPHNLLETAACIGPREPYWLDMESAVRTDDQFDLGKVESVLEQRASYGTGCALCCNWLDQGCAESQNPDRVVRESDAGRDCPTFQRRLVR